MRIRGHVPWGSLARASAMLAIVAAMACGGSAFAQPAVGSDGAPYGYGGGMMGGGYGPGNGMMGGGASNRPVWSGWGGGVLNDAQANAYIAQGDALGAADASAGSVRYSGRELVIDLVAVQPGHRDQTFAVHGLTNPTLIVPQGAVVHLNLLNMDYGENMEHGLILTRIPPPYPWMAMMDTGPGVASVMPLLPWRSRHTLARAHYAVLGTTFVARQAGTYWYVCPTPDHAEAGMYGRLIIRGATP